MGLKVIGSRLLVKVLEEKEIKTQTGIILNPDVEKSKKRYNIGVVLQKGNGKINTDGVQETVDVKVGDKIMFPKYEGDIVELDGEKFTVLAFDRVTGVVQD